MLYHLTAAEILKRLGFDSRTGQEFLEAFRKEHSCPLPRVYTEFMEAAANCPVLAASDVWPGKMIPFEERRRFLYGRLSEEEKAQTGDYLEIGSDYSAGIVVFGIRVEDLGLDDPPVYLQHEAEPVTQWRIAYETLSGFLQESVFNALALVDYSTAEEEDLEEDGSFVTEDTLREKGIDPAMVEWCACANGGRTFCCWDEEANVCYTGRWDWDEENTLYTISRMYD